MLVQKNLMPLHNFLIQEIISLFLVILQYLTTLTEISCLFVLNILALKENFFENLSMKQKILIAEDNQFTALQYYKILEKNGHTVVITRNGEECIEKYFEELKKEDKLTNPFDVVILDQSMPKKTGKEVAKMILEKKPYQRIIFASAYFGSDEISENSTENVEIIQKPFSLTKFAREVGN